MSGSVSYADNIKCPICKGDAWCDTNVYEDGDADWRITCIDCKLDVQYVNDKGVERYIYNTKEGIK